MGRLSPTTNVGTGVSSLIRSANSLQTSIANYQDSVQAFQYENSGHTDEAYQAYKDYLANRINTLTSVGTISDAQKALTLTKTLETATHSNVSANIQRENIQIMAGNATLTDKYNVIVNEYTKAVNNGDLTLAQSLESQAYSVSQTIQYQNQQAADAAATLAKAGNGTTTGTSGVTYQSDVVTNLKDSLNYFKGLAKNGSEKELNTALKDFVTSNKSTFEALGVKVPDTQPNYFNVVAGIAGAVYNHAVLKAQAEAPINPLVSATYAQQAADYLSGATKFDTLAGSLSLQEIQQAQQDPAMFAYDNSTGAYKRTTQVGYQYQPFTDPQTGKQYKSLVPQYSGVVSQKSSDQTYFLTPTETATMTKLGLAFSKNSNGTTGDGVQVQLTSSSPDWLRGKLGENGVANFYTDQSGNLIFKAGSSSGQGNSFYTLTTDARGLSGLFEHTIDGKLSLAGGDYGFNAGAAQMLINQGEQTQRQISLNEQAQAATLAAATPKPLPSISVSGPTAPRQNIAVPQVATPAARAIAPPHIVAPQRPTVNPQQPSGADLQGGSFNLQGGGGGIRLQ